MKPFRLFLYFSAAVFVLLVMAVGVAFTSGFQTWAARKVLADEPALHATLGRVSAGLGRVNLESVSVEPNGAVLTLPALTAELPLLSAALSKKVTITKLVAKGWTLDLTKAKPAAPSAPTKTPPAPRARLSSGFSLLPSAYAADSAAAATVSVFQGVFSQLKLPVDLSLDGVELEGDVLLPAVPDAPAARVHVRIAGGGLAAGREGRFALDLAVAFTGENLPVDTLTVHATLVAAMDTPRTFTRLETEAAAAAKGAKFPAGVKLVATVAAMRAAPGENYLIALVLEGKELVAVHADYPGDARALTGSWKLNLRTADLAPFTLGRALPAIDAVGDGKFSADPAFVEIHASGRLDATADQLAVIKPELAVVGVVKLAAEFDLAQQGGALRIDHLAVQFDGARPIASVRSLQPFEFNAKTGELKVAEPARELLALNLQGVPLAWLQPFLKNLRVTGGDVRGELAATASNGGLALRSKTPLTVTEVSLASPGASLVRTVDVSLGFSADYTPQGWQAEIAPLTLGSGGATLLTLHAKAGQLAGKDQPFKATGRWSASLPAIFAQPALAAKAGLLQGDAAGEFTATLAGKKEIQATLALTNLAADPTLTKETLPAITVDLRADLDAAGEITFAAPFTFERAGRKSDLTLAGTALPAATTTALDVRVTSSLLVVEDVQVLAALAPPSVNPAADPELKKKADEKPFWAGLTGQFALALKKVVYADNYEVADVVGTLRLEDGALKLDGVRAGLGEGSEVKLKGGVTFSGQRREPYALTADFALNNFDSAPLFRALDPGKLPTVEGRFNVTSSLAGSGINAGQLVERTRGEFLLTSKTGLFRGLSADMVESLKQSPSMFSSALNAVSASGVGALLGLKKEKIDDASEYLDKQGKVVVEIADRLKEISYDQINVVATRDEALNIRLKEFSLISPEVRLSGTGQITYREGVSPLAQPLELRLQLGARGRVENLMNNVALLDGRRDDLGYANMTDPVRLGGTLENVDRSGLKKILLEAAIRKAKSSLLENLGGLLGR